MPLTQLDSENADRDITSLITVLTDTPDAASPMLCQALVVLGDGAKDLDGTGGGFELTITVGGQTIEPNPQTVEFSTALRTSIWSSQFPVPSNTEVVVRVLSPNVADSDVDVTAYLYDVHDATNAVIQSQLSGIANVGAAVHEPVVAEPDGFVLTTGTNEQNDEDSTRAADGTEHEWDSTGNAMDGRYLFNIGGANVPVLLTIMGRLQGAFGDTVQINVNTGTIAAPTFTPATNQRGQLVRQPTSVNGIHTFALFVDDVMTGADAGKVQVQIVNDGAVTGATFSVDQMFCSKSSKADATGYSLGAIWYDDSKSNENTVPDVDGTARNAVSSWAAVLALMASVGTKRAYIANGSTVTLTGNSDNFTLLGHDWTLELENRSIDGLHAENADVSGTGTNGSTPPSFENCHIDAVTLPPCHLTHCGIGGTFTAGSNGDYFLDGCHSSVAGSGVPTLDFSGLGAATNIKISCWCGGANIVLDSDCTLSHEVEVGGATTVTTGGADAEVRGIITSLTATMSAAETVQFCGITGSITLNGTTTATVNLYGVRGTLTDNTSAASVTDETVSETAWDTAQDDHLGAGTMGKSLSIARKNVSVD